MDVLLNIMHIVVTVRKNLSTKTVDNFGQMATK